MSPASGDSRRVETHQQKLLVEGFHSINVPSEWGLDEVHQFKNLAVVVSIQLMSPASGDWLAQFNANHKFTTTCFHSINVPSEWGLETGFQPFAIPEEVSFHSINVPSEWGLYTSQFNECGKSKNKVSIQLMSPASGDSSIGKIADLDSSGR
jgi:hypothetical protein